MTEQERKRFEDFERDLQNYPVKRMMFLAQSIKDEDKGYQYAEQKAICEYLGINASNCNELEPTIINPLIFSVFFIYPKSGYVQSDIVVRHIFLPYFYRGTFSGFAPMSH